MRNGTSGVVYHSKRTLKLSISQSLKKFLLCTAVILVVPIFALLSPAVSEAAGPWKGQIVDKETGKPLAGVVVLAVWERHLRGTGVHGSLGGYGASQEVVTDNQGYFTIEARSSWTWNPFVYLKGPRFYIFKPGFGQWQFRGQDAWSKDTFRRQEQQENAWERFEEEGVVLELPPLKTKQERLNFYQSPGRTPAGNLPKERITGWKNANDAERVFLGFE